MIDMNGEWLDINDFVITTERASRDESRLRYGIVVGYEALSRVRLFTTDGSFVTVYPEGVVFVPRMNVPDSIRKQLEDYLDTVY